MQIFATVGKLDEIMLSVAEEFTCRLYGFGPQVKKVNEAREINVKKMCGLSQEF